MPSNKQRFILKLIMLILVIVGFGMGIYLAVVLFTDNSNFFSKHFALPISLMCIAGVAFIMPIATKTKYGGDDSKDNLMMLVAMILFLMAILSCILSFFNVFNM